MAEDRITIEVRAEGAERAAEAVDKVEQASERAADAINNASDAADNLSQSTDKISPQGLERATEAAQQAERAVDGASDSAVNLSNSIDQIDSTPAVAVSDAIDNISTSAEQAEASIVSARTAASDWGNIMSGLNASADLLGKVKDGVSGFVMGSLNARADMEALEHQLTAVVGSAEEGAEQLKKIKEMANTTVVIDTEGAVSGVAAFMRMGESADDAREKIQILSNAVAYTGGGAEQIKNATTQIEQMASKTGSFNDDIKALTNSIPNASALIKKHFGIESLEALNDMGVTGKEAFNALIEEMSKLPAVDGGIGETMEQIKSAQMEISAAAGEALAPAIKLVAEGAGKLAEIIDGMPDWGKDIMAWGVAATGLAAALGLGVISAGQLVTSFKALKEVGKAVRDMFVKSTVAKTADTAAEGANTAATKAGTIARKWDIKAIGQQIAKVWALVTAKIAELALSGPKGWLALAGGVAAVGLAVGGLSYLYNSNKQNTIESESERDAEDWLGGHNNQDSAAAQSEVRPTITVTDSKSNSVKNSTDDSDKKREETVNKRAEEAKKALELANKNKIAKIKSDGEIAYNNLMAKGNVLLAKKTKAEAELNAILQDATASLSQKTIAQQNYNKTIGELEAAESQKAINKQKSQLDELLNKRKSYTDKVIAEIKRARTAAESDYYEAGRLAVLTSGASFSANSDSRPFTSEETLRAYDNVRKKEALENNQRQSVDSVLYGGTTEMIKNQINSINDTLRDIREREHTGLTQIDVLNNIYTSLQRLLNISIASNMHSMA